MTVRSLVAALVVSAVLWFAAGYGVARYVARSQSVPVAQAVKAVQVATKAADLAETIAVRDSAHARPYFVRYDTARVTDTVTVDSIVYVARDVADSTVHACGVALSSCSVALAAKDTVIAAKDRQITAINADRPSRLHQLGHDALLIGAAGGAGYLLGRSGFSVSVPRHF